MKRIVGERGHMKYLRIDTKKETKENMGDVRESGRGEDRENIGGVEREGGRPRSDREAN